MTKKNQKEKNTSISLKAEVRKLVGKKTNRVRKEGYLAANVYGQKFKSKTIKVLAKDFFNIYKKIKRTGIVHLNLGKEKIPVLIRNIQYHPVKNYILHIDFRKVNLAQKIITRVPLKIIGKSAAVENKVGDLNIPINQVELESLPQDIPSNVEVDISSLKEVGDEIKIANLAKTKKYVFIQPPETVLVSISAHKEEKVEAPPPVEETEKTEETKPGEETEKSEQKEKTTNQPKKESPSPAK